MSKKNLLILVLLTSVAINLFFIGGIGFRVSNNRDFNPRPFPPNVGWVVRDLSEERRAQLEPVLRQSYDEIRPMRREMFAAQRQVNEIMASSSFDAAALDQAFAELRAASDRYQALSHQQTIKLLSELTEEERQVAQEFVQRRGPREGREGRERFRGRDGGAEFGRGFGPGRPPLAPDDAPVNAQQQQVVVPDQ